MHIARLKILIHIHFSFLHFTLLTLLWQFRILSIQNLADHHPEQQAVWISTIGPIKHHHVNALYV
jgi:hypothetical protein